MDSKKIWANLAVQDLERTTAFYKKLGFKHKGSSEDLTSFSFGVEAFVINFFLKKVLQSNIGGEFADPANGNEVIFTLSADTKVEVDDWEQEIGAAGGTIISPAKAFGDGYYGFVFIDPDGHKFNVFKM